MRYSKTGLPQSLFSYAYHVRNKYGIKTSEIIRNRNYGFMNEPEFVKKNNSIEYFKKKYMKHVLPKMIEEYSDEDLKNIITYYDGRNWELEEKSHVLRNTKIDSLSFISNKLPSP